MKNIITIITAACLMACLSSCQTLSPGKEFNLEAAAAKASPYLRPGAALVAANALKLEKDQDARRQLAQGLYASAVLVRGLSTADEMPSADEFKDALMAIGAEDDKWDWPSVVTALASVYAGFRDQFGAKPELVLNGLAQIALGLEDATKPYL